VRGVGPEHESDNDTLQRASRLRRLFLELVIGLNKSIR
jgi:hypothetical protein